MRLLSYDMQLTVMYHDGPYSARYWEEQGKNLYHLPAGFFAELYYNPASKEVEEMRRFTRARLLAGEARTKARPHSTGS